MKRTMTVGLTVALSALLLSSCAAGAAAERPQETKASEEKALLVRNALEAQADFDQLVAWSDDVVSGTLVGVSDPKVIVPAAGNGMEMVVTDYTFAVDGVYKGDMSKGLQSADSVKTNAAQAAPSGVITVRIPGGETAGVKYVNDGATKMAEGNSYLLFLMDEWVEAGYNFDTGDGSYFLISSASGVWNQLAGDEYANDFCDASVKLSDVDFAMTTVDGNAAGSTYDVQKEELEARHQAQELDDAAYERALDELEISHRPARILTDAEVSEWEESLKASDSAMSVS